MDQSILTDFLYWSFYIKMRYYQLHPSYPLCYLFQTLKIFSVYVMNPYNLVTSMFSQSCQDLELQVLF